MQTITVEPVSQDELIEMNERLAVGDASRRSWSGRSSGFIRG